jgi:hypothetical protein
MYDRVHVARMLSVPRQPSKSGARQQILGVPYGSEIRYPDAQSANGEAVRHLKHFLEAHGDTDPWKKLMVPTAPVEGFGDGNQTLLERLHSKPEQDEFRQVVALALAWAA